MLHILLVEDSELNAKLLRDTLLAWSPRSTISHARSLADARRFLSANRPDLVLLDYKLPDGIGTELLREGMGEFCPFVMLTGSGDEQAAAEVMRAGALDYLVKSAETMESLPQIVERTFREWNHIRGRREAEEALRASEAKYRNLFDNMSDAVALDELVLDAEGKAVDWRVIEANPAYEIIYGISRREAVGRQASELYAGRFEYGPILEAAAEALSQGRPQQAEFYFSGSTKYLLISVFPLGERKFATLGRDITERRRNEIEQERLLAQLDATINAIADAVIIYGPNGEIRHMNPAAREKFAYTADNRERPLRERLAGYHFETPDGEPFPFQEVMQRVVAGERMEGVLVVMRRPDGREIWLSNSAAPIRTADGQLVGAVGSSTDITELHRLQEDRDQYLHTMSHDLRMPLTVIRGYSQLLEEYLGQGEREGQVPLMLGELSAGVSRMSRMIDDLVETARLEGGKVFRQPACLRLDLVVEGMRRRVADGVDWSRLQVELPADLPPVEADPDHLERILMNLLTNACKYSPPEKPVRLVAARQGPELLVSVIDRGEGIALQDQPHIFERFYRTARGVARRDSVGLGLYITRKLVETNGGRIRVESEPGRGSTFSFILPVA